MSEDKNLHDNISGPIIANELEQKQIGKFHVPGGTGFAAEDANALQDRLQGHTVEQTGHTNTLNGPDRIVDGVPIQTKYFDNPHKTMGAAFDDTGAYRYNDQLLEVPSDQYEDCLRIMRRKIEQGKVAGVQDPKEAENIIKKGHYTYKQARNIAKAGNIDSLTYDIKTQAVTLHYAFAISFAINFAQYKWNGQDMEQSIKGALGQAFQSSTTSFVVGIVTSQILRTSAAGIGAVIMRDGVRTIVQNPIGREFVHNVAYISLGKAVYGAAAVNHVAKLLRTNVITSVVMTVVVSAPDLYSTIIEQNMSWKQFAKNSAVNGMGIAGGTGGWLAGAAGGAAIGSAVPVIGTVIGGVVGGLVGGLLGGVAVSSGTKQVLDWFVEDDAQEMVGLLQKYLEVLANDYLLTENELKELVEIVKEQVDTSFLKRMYQSSDRQAFVTEIFEPHCMELITKRQQIVLPDEAQVQAEISEIEGQILASNEDEYPD